MRLAVEAPSAKVVELCCHLNDVLPLPTSDTDDLSFSNRQRAPY